MPRIPRYFTYLALAMGLFALAVPAAAQGARGRVDCEATENGDDAAAAMAVYSGARQVATGSCGDAVAVPAGSYEVRVRLDGALDRPEQRRRIQVQAGRRETVRVDFRTGTLEVAVTSDGRRAAGRAVVYRNGEEIGTVAGGVGAHLSAGTYDIVVRYRSEERRFEGVSIAPGQRRVVSAEF